MRKFGMALSIVLLIASWSLAEEDKPAPGPAEQKVDKWQFTLLNPTPRDAMREFSTDRPDVTESPYTVDAGHFQYETSLVSYTGNNHQSERADLVQALGVSNFKVGLLNNTDLQVVLNPYNNLLTRTKDQSTRVQGGGPAQLRLKVNLVGNDSGDFATALLPFIQFPTGNDSFSSDHVEGGLIVPATVKLPAGFDLSGEVRFDFVRNDANDGYGMNFIHTLSLEHDLFVKKLSGYVEYVGLSPQRTGLTYAPALSTGMTYALKENVQLDAGTIVGLDNSVDNINIFIGLSFRI